MVVQQIKKTQFSYDSKFLDQGGNSYKKIEDQWTEPV